MVRKLLLLFLLVSFSAQGQGLAPDKLFSQEIGKNIKRYRQKSQDAYADRNFERAEFLFDSLVKNVINGSYLDNFEVRKISGRKIELYDFDKPIFLLTYASWCTPGIGEIPALNEVAEKYHKEIDFVILFWDSKKKARKKARKYTSKFTILYVDEKENTNNYIVETMKHSLGFPTNFFIDGSKKIIDIRRGVLHAYDEEFNVSYNLNYNALLSGVSLLKNIDTKKSSAFLFKEIPTP